MPEITFEAIVRTIGKTKYIPIPKDFPTEKGKSLQVNIKSMVPEIELANKKDDLIQNEIHGINEIEE